MRLIVSFFSLFIFFKIISCFEEMSYFKIYFWIFVRFYCVLEHYFVYLLDVQ